jgi:dephospho-CoA kinase
MLKIGITGGIGSGKSTAAKVFALLGVPIYYADDAAKAVMNTDQAVQQAIIAAFGENSYVNSVLDRSYLAARVFNDPKQLELLNSIVHPATIRDADKWIQNQQAPYVIKEAALLFESGSYSALDYVIGISAPYPLRLHRAMKRDNISREQVIARMNKQIDENIKMKLCDFVLYNDEAQLLIPQILDLHHRFAKG